MADATLQQIAQDLKWAFTAPFLLKNSLQLPDAEWNDSLLSSSAFVEFFKNEPSSHRVGYYFESLVHFWLQGIRGVEVLEHGLQIQDGKRTVGELDFVFRDETGDLNHWEVAVKFYLHSTTQNHSGSHFIGPNARDTLERKYTRFIEHQLPLGKRTIPEIVHQAMFVKGQIFYHPTDIAPVVSPLLADDHSRAMWIRESEMGLLEAIENASRFRILQKPFWLSGSTSETTDISELVDWMKSHFKNSEHPVLISAVNSDEIEVERIFVVNDCWPEVD